MALPLILGGFEQKKRVGVKAVWVGKGGNSTTARRYAGQFNYH